MTQQQHLSEPGIPTGQNLVSPRNETSRSLQGLLGLLVVVFYPCKKADRHERISLMDILQDIRISLQKKIS